MTGRTHELTRLWADALAGVIVRHLNQFSRLLLRIEDEREPMLYLTIDRNPDSNDPATVFESFTLTNVRLTFFPGAEAARKWLAAAWAGFMYHEALELVTVGDLRSRVIDPHASRAFLDYGFHRAMPMILTPETIVPALTMAMPPHEVCALLAEAA